MSQHLSGSALKEAIFQAHQEANLCEDLAIAHAKAVDEYTHFCVKQVWMKRWVDIADFDALNNASSCTDLAVAGEKFLSAPADGVSRSIWDTTFLRLARADQLTNCSSCEEVDVALTKSKLIRKCSLHSTQYQQFYSDIFNGWYSRALNLVYGEVKNSHGNLASKQRIINFPGRGREILYRKWRELSHVKAKQEAPLCQDVDVARTEYGYSSGPSHTIWLAKFIELADLDAKNNASTCSDLFVAEGKFSASHKKGVARNIWKQRYHELVASSCDTTFLVDKVKNNNCHSVIHKLCKKRLEEIVSAV